MHEVLAMNVHQALCDVSCDMGHSLVIVPSKALRNQRLILEQSALFIEYVQSSDVIVIPAQGSCPLYP